MSTFILNEFVVVFWFSYGIDGSALILRTGIDAVKIDWLLVMNLNIYRFS